jgi:hypothetical protein
MNMSKIACLECGEPVGATQRNDKKFCCAAHKDAFTNRRKNRGAAILDLMMVNNFDRKNRKGLQTLMYRMCRNWLEEDREAGRASWLPLHEAKQRQVQHSAVHGRVSRKRS